MTRILSALVLLALYSSNQAVGATVVAGNLQIQWRPLYETKGFTWTQIATVCDPNTGACSGSLNGVSFDGWVWANGYDIGNWFFGPLITPANPAYFAAGHAAPNYSNVHDLGIPLAIQAIGATDTSFYYAGGYALSYGWSRDRDGNNEGYIPNLVNNYDLDAVDGASMSFAGDVDSNGEGFIGAWLYQTTPVPIPAAAWLLGGALAGLGLLRRAATRSG